MACPAVAHGEEGYEEKTINKAKATKLSKLRRMTAYVADASNFNEMKKCKPERRPMVDKLDA